MIGRKFWVLTACALTGVMLLASLGGCPAQVPAGAADPPPGISASPGDAVVPVVAGVVVTADPGTDPPAQPDEPEPDSQISTAGDNGTGGQPDYAAVKVDPESMDFGWAGALQVLTLSYAGLGTLPYEIRSEAAWVMTSPRAGVLGAQPTEITVTVNRSGLEPGSYVGALVIESAGIVLRRVAIRMQVLEPPALRFGPAVLDFGSEMRTLTLRLWNEGSGSLTYTVTPREDWITVEPDGGELTTESDTIEVTVHRGALTVGPHEGHLLIVASHGAETAVPVALEKPLTNPLLIPWVEANIADETEIRNVVAGMQIWNRVTDRVVVTTGYGKAYLFRELRARVPHMRVIPSIKTSYWLMADFDSPAAWAALAQHVQAFLDASGETLIVFEHETALSPYHAGTFEMDFNELARGLSYLPTGVVYGWAPGLGYSHTNPNLLPRSIALAEAVQAALDGRERTVRFVDLSYNDPGWPFYLPALEARAALEALATETPMTLAYFGCSNGYCYWPTYRIRELMEQVRPRPDLLLYPGSRSWVPTATAIANELSDP